MADRSRRVYLRARGAELVGQLERYEDSYRLCYVRGPDWGAPCVTAL